MKAMELLLPHLLPLIFQLSSLCLCVHVFVCVCLFVRRKEGKTKNLFGIGSVVDGEVRKLAEHKALVRRCGICPSSIKLKKK